MSRLQQLRAAHTAELAKMNAIRAAAEGRSLSIDEGVAWDTAEAHAKVLARDIEREEAIQAEQAANAEPARPRVVNAPAVLTKTTQAQRNGDRFKGQSVARFALALAHSRIKNIPLQEVMHDRFGRSRPELVKLAKPWQNGGPGSLQSDVRRVLAANEIAGGGTGSGDWGNELVQLDSQYSGDFIDLLRSKTVFDRLALRTVPANVTIKGQDGTGTAYWVGEHKPIPMSAQDYSSVTLTPLKIGALTAISIELTQDSSPDGEQFVTDSLVKDAAQLVDSTFFSATAASNGVSPAGILNGVSLGSSAGTDHNGLITDTDTLVQAFITAKNTGGLAWASRPGLAAKIAGMRNAFGNRLYEGLTEDGGTYEGKPFYTSDNVGDGDFLLLKPSDIYRIGDSGLSVDISTEATLEFASDPTGAGDATPVGQSKQPVSLFQAGMIGIRLFRRINWAKRRSGAVVGIGDAAYVPQIQTA